MPRSVIAGEAKQSLFSHMVKDIRDCFVVSLLAMTKGKAPRNGKLRSVIAACQKRLSDEGHDVCFLESAR